MTTPTGYHKYPNDEAKAEVYEHRLFIADQDFNKWKSKAEEWYSRYENRPRRAQVTAKGHRVNVTTGVATIDSLFSAMTAVDIDVTASATQGAPRIMGELAGAALSQEWDLLDGQVQTNAAVKDALVVGIGWVKVAYEYESEVQMQNRNLDDIRQDIAVLLAEAQGIQGAPTPEQIADLVPVEESVEVVLRDRIVVDYVPWDSVRTDPNAKRIEDVTWVAQCNKVHLEDVKNNPAYRAYCKRTRGGLSRLDELKGSSTYATEMLPSGKPTDDDQFAEVVEFTDLRSGTVCTFVRGQKWLLNETVNPFMLNTDLHRRSPFVPLVLRKTNTRLRGVSDMELMAPSLDEQDIYRSKTATFIERFVPKVIGPEDALTEEGKRNLSSSEYGSYVSVAREYAGDPITPMNPPVLPSESWDMERRVEESIREATGVNELMRGLFPDRKRTATETAEVVSASSARQSEKRNTLEEFYMNIFDRVLQLMQMFYDQERMVRYVDPAYGEVEWAYTQDDIQNKFKLAVHLTPKEAQTRQQMRDDALAYFNMMMPLAMQPQQDGSTLVDGAKLVEWFSLQYGLSRTEVLDILNLPEEKQAQQLAQQQAMAAQAGAQAGMVNPGMTTGPLGPGEVAALTNQGAVPPEVAAQAVGGIGPGVEQAVEAVSESAGVRLP